MQTNIRVCCCKAKGKFDLVLPTQKSSIFHLKSTSAGAQANISSSLLPPTPHLLLGWQFPNKPISAVPSPVESKLISSPQSNVLTPELATVILGSKTQQNPKQWQNALFAKFLCTRRSAPSHAALKRHPEKEPDIKLPPGEKKRNEEIIKKEKGNGRAGVSTAKDANEEGGGGGGQLQSA